MARVTGMPRVPGVTVVRWKLSRGSRISGRRRHWGRRRHFDDGITGDAEDRRPGAHLGTAHRLEAGSGDKVHGRSCRDGWRTHGHCDGREGSRQLDAVLVYAEPEGDDSDLPRRWAEGKDVRAGYHHLHRVGERPRGHNGGHSGSPDSSRGSATGWWDGQDRDDSSWRAASRWVAVIRRWVGEVTATVSAAQSKSPEGVPAGRRGSGDNGGCEQAQRRAAQHSEYDRQSSPHRIRVIHNSVPALQRLPVTLHRKRGMQSVFRFETRRP